MAFDVEQPEFEGREQPAGARANDNDIGGDFSAHACLKSIQTGTASQPRNFGPIGARRPALLSWEPPLSPAAPALASKATNALHLSQETRRRKGRVPMGTSESPTGW
ncbi:MAG: hypothetical protein Devi2KO_33320 [Devosia indica]